MSSGAPAPTSIVTVLPATTFLAGIHSFAQQSISDATTAAEVRVDLTSRTVNTGLSVTLQISYDGGTTWNIYSAGIAVGESSAGSFLGIGIGKANGLPNVTGRLIQGSFTVTGQVVSTSLKVALW